jgi:hypothetical protein
MIAHLSTILLLATFTMVIPLIVTLLPVGGEYIATAHHDLGKAWSIYLRNFIEQSMRTLIGINPSFEISGDTVSMRFKA